VTGSLRLFVTSFDSPSVEQYSDPSHISVAGAAFTLSLSILVFDSKAVGLKNELSTGKIWCSKARMRGDATQSLWAYGRILCLASRKR
jgi:hypothetical protein